MNYFIGIDGGGSRTRCVAAGRDSKILAQTEGGPSNPLSVGVEKSARILFDLIKKVMTEIGIRKADSAVIGLAGAGREKKAEEVKRALLKIAARNKIILEKLDVTTDIEISAEGAFRGKSGFVLIAGTGSVIYGRDREGRFLRAGGYGRILGDEGSGYSIGRKGLNAVAKSYDGRGRGTLLAGIIGREFGIFDRDNLISVTYNGKFEIASIAPLVISAADAGDSVCRKILDGEIKELILHVKAIRKNSKNEKLRLSLGGGLLSSKNYYSLRLAGEIKKRFRNIKITEVEYPPEQGAIFLAIKNSDKSKDTGN